LIQSKLNKMKKTNKKRKTKVKSRKISKKFSTVTWIPIAVPLICWLLYVSLAIHCRLAVGHWPQPMIENINIKSYEIHESVLWVFSFVFFASLPCWLIMLLFKKLRINIKIHFLQFIVFGLGLLLIILTLMFDPTPFTEWFFD